MNLFLYLAVAFIVGLLSTRLMKLLKLPNVTGYLLTGIIIGPCVLGLFFNGFKFNNVDIASSDVYNLVNNMINANNWFSNLALGFIAFTIGSSFKFQTLKKVGGKIVLITIFEALGACVVVFLALMVVHFIIPTQVTWPIVLTLAAISCATAPAATLMVIKQYKAKGPVVETLLPVVALDDAVALIMFSILFGLAKSIDAGNGAVDYYEMIGKPIIDIVLSIAIGAVLGFIITYASRLFKSRANRVMWIMVAIFGSVGLTILFSNEWAGGFACSSLLMCMVSGAIYVNFRKDSDTTLNVIDHITPPIFMLFFIISGASLDLTVFSNYIVLIIAGVYVISRVVGKWVGAWSSCEIAHTDKNVKKYLGFTLIPQAGVAIGLAQSAQAELSKIDGSTTGAIILAVILTSTIIYELVGPAITKQVLIRAGEINILESRPVITNTK